ncbi:MAG: hypothetical protein K2G70_07660 [Turicibacter sp.]|nr:hypothetical protein [Turicibacter sp.]
MKYKYDYVDTLNLLLSSDWKVRLIGEYHLNHRLLMKLKRRREKNELIRKQIAIMEEYHKILQQRCVEYGIDIGIFI